MSSRVQFKVPGRDGQKAATGHLFVNEQRTVDVVTEAFKRLTISGLLKPGESLILKVQPEKVRCHAVLAILPLLTEFLLSYPLLSILILSCFGIAIYTAGICFGNWLFDADGLSAWLRNDGRKATDEAPKDDGGDESC